MREVSNAGTARANEVTAESCEQRIDGRVLPDLWFARMARELWQFKVAAHLHATTGRSERTCRAWEAGDNEPGCTTLAQLLRSPDGPRVLSWVMRGCDEPWWATAEVLVDISRQYDVTRR